MIIFICLYFVFKTNITITVLVMRRMFSTKAMMKKELEDKIRYVDFKHVFLIYKRTDFNFLLRNWSHIKNNTLNVLAYNFYIFPEERRLSKFNVTICTYTVTGNRVHRIRHLLLIHNTKLLFHGCVNLVNIKPSYLKLFCQVQTNKLFSAIITTTFY